MRIEKQTFSIPIVNHDQKVSSQQFRKHGDLFGGNSKRALIVGSSNSGKTNLMLTLLEHPNGVRFENVYIYSKSLTQPKYAYLRKLLLPIKEIGYFEYENDDCIIPPNDIKSNSIIIFDDIPCQNQSVIRDYFTLGRHKNTDCFLIFQGYSSIFKRLIRENSNLIILFKQDSTSLKHIYNDHCMMDMSFDQFKEICTYCWKEPYGFMVIDKDCDLSAGRYRKNLDSFIYL